jgi:hypothetical protein
VKPRNNFFEFATVAPGSSSQRAGVLAGDALLCVDETPIVNWPLDMVVSMLKGEPGTWVRLTLQRNLTWGGKTQFDVMVQREAPANPHMLENMRKIPAEGAQAFRGLPSAAAPRGVGMPAAAEQGAGYSGNLIMDPLLGSLNHMNLMDGMPCACSSVRVCVEIYMC